MPTQKKCFVIMPFEPELNFMYLYIKQYLTESHGLNPLCQCSLDSDPLID